MARAKRTDRAEARRRYRAAIAPSADEPELELDDAGEDDEAAPAPASSSRRSAPSSSVAASRAATTARPARPGMLTAFRAAFRPVRVRDDLRALPQILRHWSFFVPVVLSGIAVVLIQYFPHDPLVGTLASYFTGLTPFASVFLGGFFAPRASYLVGALISIVAAGFLALSYTVQFGGLPDGVFVDLGVGQQALVSSTDLREQYPSLIFQALTAGTIYGGLFAAAAAWYRRFLNLANPNRARMAAAQSSRRPDGKVPKRNQQRPMLARRR